MKKIKKNDLIFIIILGIVCVVMITVLLFRGEKKGNYVRVCLDGKTYGEYSLFEDQEIIIEEKSGKNTVKIEHGKVSMIFADCPDQYCVKHAPIDNGYEPIVCLPHKVVVEIIEKGL